jgi:hypothetical protein
MFARAALSVLADELDPPGRWRRRKRAQRSKPGKQPKEPPRAEPKQPPHAEPKRPQAAPKQPPQAEPKRPQAATKKPPQAAPKPPEAEPAASYAAPQSAESAGWGATSEPQSVPVIRIETDDGSTVSPLSVLGDRAYVAPRAQRERKPGESRRVRRTARAEDSIPEPTPQPRSPEMTACIARMRARASGTAVTPQLPVAPPRRRPAGEPLALTRLAPTTLLLLQSGEPLTDAATAA